MSSTKKITQSELRKAMTEAKKKVATVKKIASPLAKYTDSGQLVCIVCKSIIQAEALWSAHLNSKNHKENLISATKSIGTKAKPERSAPSPVKRPSSPPAQSSPNKRVRGPSKNAGRPNESSSLPADFFDVVSKDANDTSATAPSNNGDVSVLERSKECGNKTVCDSTEETNGTSLPEGFFDDPRMDAKVRNVDYKDPIEEEWDKFQKEIKEETAQSAQIIADDQVEATTERQIDEIEEQIRNWSRVMDLVRRKEQVCKDSEKQKDWMSDEASSDEDEEYDEFLDWRAKNSYR